MQIRLPRRRNAVTFRPSTLESGGTAVRNRNGLAIRMRLIVVPCPRCGNKIQRIRYGSNETNYCPKCQTGGKLLADRALSRLLKDDWPRTPEELENLTKG